MTPEQIAELMRRYQVDEDTIRRYWLTNPAIRESLMREMRKVA